MSDKLNRIEDWYNKTIRQKITAGKVIIPKGFRIHESELHRLIYSRPNENSKKG